MIQGETTVQMTDQSRRGGITLLLTECLISLEIIAKILKKEELNRLEIEEIKVYSRNPQICSELAETLVKRRYYLLTILLIHILGIP